MKLLLASSEVAGFARTGGLAEVAAALPRELASLGHDVRIVMPCYGTPADDAARDVVGWAMERTW